MSERQAAVAPTANLTSLRVFVVSHTHWDREWYAPFQQFRFRLVDLIDEVLDLLDNAPGYEYFMLDGQTILLEDYLAIRPERETDLRRHVEAGRLLIGPWYVLPDEFLVSPEALIRNLQRGLHTGEAFGGAMMVGYIPDPFGHVGQMPQILRGFGITAAAVGRGLGDERVELQWQAADGSCVLLIYLRDGYGNFAWLPRSSHLFEARLEESVRSFLAGAVTVNALLLNGTDHLFPEPKLPQLLEAARQALPEWEIRHSTLPRYIEAVRVDLANGPQLQVVTDELRSPAIRHLLPGVLSTRMWIKQENDAAETWLERYAEPLNAWGSLLTGVDRRPQLGEAWRLLLENHPHDSICGCSIDEVHAEMRPRFAGVMQIGRELVAEGLRHLAAQVNFAFGPASSPPPADPTTWQMKPWPAETCGLLVFNPVSTTRTDRVEVEVRLPGPPETVEVMAEDGTRRPVVWQDRPETLRSEQTVEGEELQHLLDTAWEGHFGFRRIENLQLRIVGREAKLDILLRDDERAPDLTALHQFLHEVTAGAALSQVARARVRTHSMATGRLCFVASDVPGHGYRAFQLRPAPASRQPRVAAQPMTWIANQFFRVGADRETGTLTLQDLRSGQTLPGLNQLADGGDAGDLYSYSAPPHDRKVRQPREPAAVEVSVTAVDQTLTVRYVLDVPAKLSPDRQARSAASTPLDVAVTARLMEGVQRLDLTTFVENSASDHRLRAHFPVADAARAWAGAHFDVVERPTEAPPAQPTWAEDPPPTFPQRGWAAIERLSGEGLLVAARGLPEVEVTPDTQGQLAIKLTLLRCIGDLSRDDLATRRGHAGPTFATPGAQCPGSHRFDVSLVPYTNGWRSAMPAAHHFRAPLHATSGQFGAAPLPSSASLLEVEPDELILSAVKRPADGRAGLIVRLWNPTTDTLDGSILPLFTVVAAMQSNLREEAGPQQPMEQNRVKFSLRPKQIATLRLEFGQPIALAKRGV